MAMDAKTMPMLYDGEEEESKRVECKESQWRCAEESSLYKPHAKLSEQAAELEGKTGATSDQKPGRASLLFSLGFGSPPESQQLSQAWPALL